MRNRRGKTQRAERLRLKAHRAPVGFGWIVAWWLLGPLCLYADHAYAQPDQTGWVQAPTDAVAGDVSFYYLGQIVPWLSGSVRITYNGTSRELHIENRELGRWPARVWVVRPNDAPAAPLARADAPGDAAHAAAKGLPGGGALNGVAIDGSGRLMFDPSRFASDSLMPRPAMGGDALRGAAEIAADAVARRGIDKVRVDASASGSAITPSLDAYLQTRRGRGPLDWAASGGPSNAGLLLGDISYGPWGRPDAAAWFNVSVAAQYVSYFPPDGVARSGFSGGALSLSLWAGTRF